MVTSVRISDLIMKMHVSVICILFSTVISKVKKFVLLLSDQGMKLGLVAVFTTACSSI